MANSGQVLWEAVVALIFMTTLWLAAWQGMTRHYKKTLSMAQAVIYTRKQLTRTNPNPIQKARGISQVGDQTSRFQISVPSLYNNHLTNRGASWSFFWRFGLPSFFSSFIPWSFK